MPGMDAWVQLAVNVVLSGLLVLLVEVLVVPRVTRRLATEEAARAERLDIEAARRSEELHRQALAHAERVARDARYGDALFALRAGIRDTLRELVDLRARLIQAHIDRPDHEPRMTLLRSEIEALRGDAGDFAQSATTVALSRALEALPGGGTTRVLSDAEPHLREALRLVSVSWIVWLGLTDRDIAPRMAEGERRMSDSP